MIIALLQSLIHLRQRSAKAAQDPSVQDPLAQDHHLVHAAAQCTIHSLAHTTTVAAPAAARENAIVADDTDDE